MDPKVSTDVTLATDPCAIRLNDIGGALLLYYSINKQLPDRLEDLSAPQYSESPLNFTCPASGKPYGYVPAGLMLEGRRKRIIVYDPTPAHDGARFCILMASDSRPGAAQSVEVLKVPEDVFSRYHLADE